MVLRQQPHGARARVVMIAFVRGLDLDVAELGLVEQMAGEFAAGARQIRPLNAVPLQNVLDPQARAEHQA